MESSLAAYKDKIAINSELTKEFPDFQISDLRLSLVPCYTNKRFSYTLAHKHRDISDYRSAQCPLEQELLTYQDIRSSIVQIIEEYRTNIGLEFLSFLESLEVLDPENKHKKEISQIRNLLLTITKVDSQ